jgi:hypothetical protein
MAESINPAAPHHLPSFITAPDHTDVLMVVMSMILVLAVVMFGVLFFRLHTLPERIAHKSQKVQFEIVAVLGLISLFTHMHIFWIAGLLLALVELPDFGGTLGRIAGSIEKLAGIKPGEGAAEVPLKTGGDLHHGDGVAGAPPAVEELHGHGGRPTLSVKKPANIRATEKEPGRA